MSSNRAFQVGLCHFGQMPVRVLVPESQPEDIPYLCTEQEVVTNFHAEVPQDFFHVVIESLVAQNGNFSYKAYLQRYSPPLDGDRSKAVVHFFVKRFNFVRLFQIVQFPETTIHNACRVASMDFARPRLPGPHLQGIDGVYLVETNPCMPETSHQVRIEISNHGRLDSIIAEPEHMYLVSLFSQDTICQLTVVAKPTRTDTVYHHCVLDACLGCFYVVAKMCLKRETDGFGGCLESVMHSLGRCRCCRPCLHTQGLDKGRQGDGVVA